MNKRRLLKLAEFLDALPPKRFDYASWVGDDWKGAQDLSCGTTACALGWAATIPTFRRAGLRLMRDSSWSGKGFVTLRGHKGSSSDEAACAVFGLTYEEFEHLFLPRREHSSRTKPDAAATAKQVAAHIRRFVEAGGIPETK